MSLTQKVLKNGFYDLCTADSSLCRLRGKKVCKYIYMYIKRNIENIEISRHTKKNSGKGLIFCVELNLFLILIQRINSKRYIMCVQVFTKPRIEEVFSFVIFNLFCD